MADVTRRMLDLLTLLQTGRQLPSAELARRLGVSPRTVRRDVDRLRGYGYPVRTRPGPGGHYRLTAGRAVPPLMLEDDEAVAVLLALASTSATDPGEPGSVGGAAARAYGKLDQFLPARLAATVSTLRAGLEADAPTAPPTDIGALSVLSTAIRDRRVVEFVYRGRETETTRRVEPHRQVHHLLRWYLLGWDLDKQDWRIFRSDRLRDLQVRTRVFEPRDLPAGTALEYLLEGINRSARRVELTVRLPAAEVASALLYQSMDLTDVGEGCTRIVLHCEDRHWLLLHLSRLDAEVEIHEPQEWAREIRRVATRLLEGSPEDEV
ncbi:helix-turn-helix transcriptional regulator [Brachybacterium sacelli]|uniref:DNA-binding transcriptional regulator YafY n=1 Tax=Brachybacterium sacelli TaxID=173364 RepID=A0ABS4X4G3_9MICO|nr:YafY family protein [Brachybacterium sacelli]MBP2383327.1 putative DNA-binding transcriptional regulator YafY [Brachybacterium sacelli]